MSRTTYCFDTSVLIKALVPEEGSDRATALLREAMGAGCRVVAPAFAWAEVGTVLRKKVRSGLLSESEASDTWKRFMSLAIDYVDDFGVAQSAWEISSESSLPTLYDAAFLAVTLREGDRTHSPVQLWTADKDLVKELGSSQPPYLRLL